MNDGREATEEEIAIMLKKLSVFDPVVEVRLDIRRKVAASTQVRTVVTVASL